MRFEPRGDILMSLGSCVCFLLRGKGTPQVGLPESLVSNGTTTEGARSSRMTEASEVFNGAWVPPRLLSAIEPPAFSLVPNSTSK